MTVDSKYKFECWHVLSRWYVWAAVLSFILLFSCKDKEKDSIAEDGESLRQVLYVQSLYNNHPAGDIVPQIESVIDSMRTAGRDPYYYAANNILIDRLFSDGRFAEADSLAISMEMEAKEDGDSTSIAMARRVRAQMYYKLFQPELALQELISTENYIANEYGSGSDFGTATSIQEWIWIAARNLGDTDVMNSAGLKYAEMVEENHKSNNWTDSTGHYPVTALAFKAQTTFSKGDIPLAKEMLESASKKIRPDFPARAYEHFYAVRCKIRAYDSQSDGAIADVDTLLDTHKDFPWFYVKDLLLKAEILNLLGRHEESIEAFSKYIEFHDSLSNNITQKRLQDLSILYRTELDEQHQKTTKFRTIVFCCAIALLIILLGVAYYHVKRERRRNHLLVRRLMEWNENVKVEEKIEKTNEDLPPLSRLDHYMATNEPYKDASLGRKELADFMGIPQSALGELIQLEKGISVHTYINSFRLEAARNALGSDSNEGIAEMAVRLGFGTSRTLQRAFKERYAMSPTQYRRAAREI